MSLKSLIKMRLAVVTLLVLVGYCNARPSIDFNTRASFGSRIINGEEAIPGEFPWQLALQRLVGSSWVHACGASLLSSIYVLSAAHCIDGASATIQRVVAGVHDRTDPNGVISNFASYKLHEKYNLDGEGVWGNDIAIITLVTAIFENGGSIQYASLPDNSDDAFVGRRGVISGWGRTGANLVAVMRICALNVKDRSRGTVGAFHSDATVDLPIFLQKAEMTVLSFDQCNTLLAPKNLSATVKMICLFDDVAQAGACNYDSGGPLNLNYPTAVDSRRVVAGVTSWGISDADKQCMPSFPSVYARTSTYLDWIATNTP